MASTEPVETPASAPPAETPEKKEDEVKEGEETKEEGEKKERKPLTPEELAQRKAERAEKRKEQRKAKREAVKEAKAKGEAPPPKAKAKAEKAAKPGEVAIPEGAAPKITVAKIPADIGVAELKTLFEKHGTVLKAEITKRKNRPTIGTLYLNTIADVKRAAQALNGKHKFPGEQEPLSIQVAKDAVEWGTFLKTTTDEVAEALRQYKYKPALLRSKDAKDLLNRIVFSRKKTPPAEQIAAALLVHLNAATAQELVSAKLITSAGQATQLLAEAPAAKGKAEPAKAAAKGKREDSKPALKLEKTFDAVLPHLDKLEKDRWNRMAKANLRLNERHRFRFVDILATPSLELWRWMVEDCEITPAEAGTCFAILQNYYGFTK